MGKIGFSWRSRRIALIGLSMLICVVVVAVVVRMQAQTQQQRQTAKAKTYTTTKAVAFPQSGINNQLSSLLGNGAAATGFSQASSWVASTYSGSLPKNRTCSIAKQVKALPGTSAVMVTDNKSGKTLYQRNASKAMTPASVMKLVTASSVLFTFGENTRIQTRVVVGKKKSEITVVGGGDPTLTTLKKSRYGAKATLTRLAKSVKAWAKANKVKVKQVNFDDSLFSGSARSNWGSDIYQDGFITKPSALMLDAGRKYPNEKYSIRTSNPTKALATAFIKKLGGKVKVKYQEQPAGAKVIAAVKSPKIGSLVKIMLRQSDNVLAENLGRVAAINWGYGNNYAAVGKLNQHILAIFGVPTAGTVFKDASGYGTDNKLTATAISTLLQRMTTVDSPLDTIRSKLAASGKSGTLKERFSSTSTKVPKGSIQAKTGTLVGVGAMAGVITKKQSKMTFAVLLNGDFTLSQPKTSIDNLVAKMQSCGRNLSGGN